MGSVLLQTDFFRQRVVPENRRFKEGTHHGRYRNYSRYAIVGILPAIGGAKTQQHENRGSEV